MQGDFFSNVASELGKILLGALTTIAVALLARLYQAFLSRNVQRFWRPFKGKRVTIVWTEYEVQGNDTDSRIARSAGGRYLLSRGSALAQSLLHEYLSTQVTSNSHIQVVGDKSDAPRDSHLVILGSPANNHIARQVSYELSRHFHLPVETVLDEALGDIYFRSTDDESKVWKPDAQNGAGTDYALIVRAKLHNIGGLGISNVVLISGALMYGTQAAAKAVTNHDVMNKIAELCDDAPNMAFMIQLSVAAGRPYNIQVIDKSVQPLKVNRPSLPTIGFIP